MNAHEEGQTETCHAEEAKKNREMRARYSNIHGVCTFEAMTSTV
jgi:hypothetical protein